MKNLNKYVKIVILSTFEEPNKLIDISETWFNNKARLYQTKIIKEIEKAVEEKILLKDGKFYEPNMPKLLDLVIEEINLGDDKIAEDYKCQLKQFYLKFGDFTRKTYLNFEVIKEFTKLSYRKAEQLDLKLLIQLPILLRLLEEKDKNTEIAFIRLMSLENYVKVIQKLETQNYRILQEKKQIYDFVGYNKWFSKNISKMKDSGVCILRKNLQIMKMLGSKHDDTRAN